MDVVADAVSHPDSSSVDQGEWGGSGGASRDVVGGKEKGKAIGVGDNVWIGVGDLECELTPSRDGEASWARYTDEVGNGSVGLLDNGRCEIRSSGERDGEGDGGYTRGRARRPEAVEVADPGDPTSKSRLSEVRSRRLPRPLSSLCMTSFLHCAKSLRTVSRTDTFRSLPRLGSASFVLVLSRVLTLDSPVVLFSLLMAAASRSGHSERLTNSY